MSAAADRAAKAANDIVTASNEPLVDHEQAAQETQPQETVAHAAGPAVLAPNRTDMDATDRYLEGMLDLKLAKYAYAAGAAIVRTADEMSDEVLRIV